MSWNTARNHDDLRFVPRHLLSKRSRIAETNRKPDAIMTKRLRSDISINLTEYFIHELYRD